MKRAPSSAPGAGHTLSPPSWRVWSALSIVYVLWGCDVRRHPRDGRGRAAAAGRRRALRRSPASPCSPSSPRAGAACASRRAASSPPASSACCCRPAATASSPSPSATCPPGWPHCSSPRCRCGSCSCARPSAVSASHRGTLAGVAVGFCGLAVLLLPGSRPAEATAGGVLLVLVAAGSWATGSFLSPRLSMPVRPARLDRLADGRRRRSAAGRRPGRRRAGDLHLADASAKSLLAFAYLVIAGSLVAFTAYAWLLQNVPISKVATYAYVNPLVAVLLGWALLSEQLTLARWPAPCSSSPRWPPSSGASPPRPRPRARADRRPPRPTVEDERCIKQPAVVDSVS